MPRRVTSKIHDYFIFYIDRSICQVPTAGGNICNTEIKGRHAGNLEKHVRVWHQEEWKNYWDNKTLMLSQNETSTSSVLENESQTENFSHFVNVTVNDFKTTSYVFSSTPTEKKRPNSAPRKMIGKFGNIHVNLSYNDVEKSCIEMVTVNGLPFSIVEESGFRKMLDPLLKACGRSRDQCGITKQKLQKLVKRKAEELRYRIVEEIENKLLSLQISCAALVDRNFLHFSAHFRYEGDAYAVTLALVEVNKDYTVDELQKVILKVLSDYNLKMEQIYYISVVSNHNVLKITNSAAEDYGDEVKDKQFITNVEIVKVESIMNASNMDTNSEFDFESFEVEETEVDESAPEDEVEFDDETRYNDSTDKLVNEVLECLASENNVISTKCLTNVLQLVILESLKTNGYNVFLRKIRNDVHKMRSLSNAHILKSLKCKKKLVQDCDTKLLSQFDMLERLLEIKPFIEKLSEVSSDVTINPNEWNYVVDIVESLRPCKLAATRFQEKDLTLSQFYKVWITCFLKSKKIGSALSKSICENMQKRHSTLFGNIAFKSSLLLDPRFKNTLNKKDQEEIIEHLVQLYERLMNLKPEDNEAEEIDQITVSVKGGKRLKMENCNEEDSDDDLYNYVQSIVKHRVTEQKSTKDRLQDLQVTLQTFCDSEPVLEVQDVMTFWRDKRCLFKDVYKLAEIIFSIAPVNASKDKFVSQLRYVLQPSKNLNSQLVKDILLLRTNFDLID